MSNEMVNSNAVLSEKDILKRIQHDPSSLAMFELTEEHCLAAVKIDGCILKKIPKAKQTEKICLAAVKQNGLSLQYASKKILTLTICLEAAKNNKDAVRFVPVSMRKQVKAVIDVPHNGLALEFVPPAKKTASLCRIAVENNALALEFVPNRYKTEELCSNAINADWRAIQFVHQPEYDQSSAIALLERMLGSKHSDDTEAVCNIVSKWSDNLLADVAIIKLLRKLKARVFTLKTYVQDTGVFKTQERIKYLDAIEEREFASFEEFYAYIDGDMSNAELHDFDFGGIELKKYNIEGAYINSTALVTNGLYDDTFYRSTVCEFNDSYNLSNSVMGELIPANALVHDPDVYVSYLEAQRKVYYVSDIHLNHRLIQAFPKHATEQEIMRYINDLVQNMCSHIKPNLKDFLLIAGDISFNLELARLFYKCLVDALHATRLWHGHIIVILGNHELWDWGITSHTPLRDLDGVIEEYRKLCKELGIRFLHNDLFYLDEYEPRIIRENRLKEIDSEELRQLCLKSSLTILGGLGYSGLAPEYNAAAGLYRQNLQSMEDDIQQSKRFEELYLKVSEALCDQSVIILTHTPKANWTTREYNPNWIYVSGHTHRNEFCCSAEKTFYADNQIGYDGSAPVYLKHFDLTTTYDIFRDYADGIYMITHEEYNDFNRGQNIDCSCNRANGTIHMLKRNGIYCFMFRNSKTNVYYLLNGGQIRKLSVNSLDYYYDKMICYYYAMEAIFEKYNKALEYISDCVKKIGGTGTVHGCIVDIDYYNHIFVNPQDGTLTPYFALSIYEKWEYKNVETLLLKERPDLYANYEQLLLANGSNALTTRIDISSNEIAEFVPETYMYKPNRIMRAIQYMRDVNVIRIWSDKVVETYENRAIQQSSAGEIHLLNE